MIEDLEKQNLFITSLDSERRWYRYHFLFREFLLSRLRREYSDQISDLERSAGKFYEDNGEWEASYLHFVSAQDFESAARVALKFASDYVERGRVEVLHRYFNMLPAEVLRTNPELLLQHGNAHRRLGEAGRATTAFEDARFVFEQQNNQSGKSRAITRLA